MKTFQQLASIRNIPMSVAWSLADLAERRGVLFILKSAYNEFEERVGQSSAPRGSKTEMILDAIDRTNGSFRVLDIQLQCPGVSLDLIRKVLKDLRPRVKCLARGKDAKWQKTTELIR
jgi:hypothetical protein